MQCNIPHILALPEKGQKDESGTDLNEIRFKHMDFAKLRTALFQDSSQEQFAILLGKIEQESGVNIITVREMRFPDAGGYLSSSLTHLKMNKRYVHALIAEVQRRLDVDVLIDVHTHPFSKHSVAFSGIDDADEIRFAQFLNSHFDDLWYASIVLSQNADSARLWHCKAGKARSRTARIRTQTICERNIQTQSLCDSDLKGTTSLHSRSTLALGLDVMRRIIHNQNIVLVGVGGIGSVLAEHLVHHGFNHIGLIDPDHLEVSNMNRFVGASLKQAEEETLKVDAVEKHLKRINPKAIVDTCAQEITTPAARALIQQADWILLSTDSHSSRLETLKLATRFFVPMISAGVNISVANGEIKDMSGEVITARMGDRYCLSCLGRINMAMVAAESHPDPIVREQTVTQGYVSGMNVKEPAVKTLNTMVATLAIESLVDQYMGNKRTVPIQVYENNTFRCIYEDHQSAEFRNTQCPFCAL